MATHLGLVLAGHVDAGKSTISGHLLALHEAVDARELARCASQATENNRSGWEFAYVLDTDDQERARGKTVEAGQARFETPSRRYTILDAPGHRAYVTNMLGAAAQADVGIVVISARRGEFESGFAPQGQTREHLLLLAALGVTTVIAVVNKMDDPTVEWSRERFGAIVSAVKKGGLKVRVAAWIPVSGITGANLTAKTRIKSWYTGLSLLETLDALPDLHIGLAAGEVRLPVAHVRADRQHFVVEGKLEAGRIHVGDELGCSPAGQTLMVKTAEGGADSGIVVAGDSALLIVSARSPPQVGDVICGPGAPRQDFTLLTLTVQILDPPSVVTAGYSCMLHVHTAVVPVEIEKLWHFPARRDPIARKGQTVGLRVRAARPVPCDKHEDQPRMGRVVLREGCHTIAVGKITAVAAPGGAQ